MSLCYDVSNWQKFLWNDHKAVEPGARDVESFGRQRYEAFGNYSEEVFHRLYANEEQPLEKPAPGSEWAEKLHRAADAVPEFQDLRNRCRGNDWWSGLSTASMLDTVLETVRPPDEQVPDPRKDQEVADYLKRLAEKQTDPKVREEIEMHADGSAVEAGDKADRAQKSAEMMDETEMRNAVRAGAKAANEAIDQLVETVGGLMPGTDAHSGALATRGAERKLAQVVRGNDRLRRIAELAGRLRRIATAKQREKPRHGTDEVDGVVPGDDLSRLLPTEALYAMDPDLEVVFCQRWRERALLNYELKPRPRNEQGPIVMLLDSSASMRSGDADVWGAAVALAFLEVARRQKRAFALIHFGTEVLRVDMFPSNDTMDIGRLVESVSFFAATGGTAFDGPLDAALEEAGGDLNGLVNADIVMVTDGGACVTDEWADGWDDRRGRVGVKCYSILVGNQAYEETCKRVSDDCTFVADALKDDEAMHHLFGVV